MMVMEPFTFILSFRTDRSWQTVQSDQGLHCLLYHFYLLDEMSEGLDYLFEF